MVQSQPTEPGDTHGGELSRPAGAALAARVARSSTGVADHGLEGQVLDSRAPSANAARTRLRWLRQQDRESATFIGALTDLAERQCAVILTTVGGRSFRGAVAAIGADFISVRGEQALVLVRLDTLATATADASATELASGDRAPVVDFSLVDQINGLIEGRLHVTVWMGAAVSATGTLRACGSDVCTIMSPVGPPGVFARIAAITEVVVFDA